MTLLFESCRLQYKRSISKNDALYVHLYDLFTIVLWNLVAYWYCMGMYRVSRYLRPPLHSITGQGHTPNLYIFMIPHQFQIYMQDFKSPTWFAYFRWHGLWCGVEHIFVNKFCIIFWGALTKMAIKVSIIGADPYMIYHFKAYIFRHAVKL